MKELLSHTTFFDATAIVNPTLPSDSLITSSVRSCFRSRMHLAAPEEGKGLLHRTAPIVSPTTQASAAAAACVKKPDFRGEVARGLITEDEALVNGAVTDADKANEDEERGV